MGSVLQTDNFSEEFHPRRTNVRLAVTHQQCIRNMIPYFYTAGHFQYAKGAQLYLQSMTNLSDRMTEEEFSLFTSHSYFSVRRTKKVFSGTWTDMILEQNLMRSLKVSGGITHGRDTSDSV